MKKSFSIIIETENLGMASINELYESLDSIKDQVLSNKRIIEVLLIIGTHLSQSLQQKIISKYPWVKLCVEKNGLEYTESKMYGAKRAKGEILIYADSDMKYERFWLKNMIKAIDSYGAETIISGDTRLESDSSYKMSLNMSWMVQISSDKIKNPTPYEHFPLNNFAIYKRVILETPIPYNIPLYRNKIPVWQEMLNNKNYKCLRAPGTKGFHAPPSKFKDWWYRMLIYGSDFVALSDFTVDANNKIIETNDYKKRFFRFLILLLWKIKQIATNLYKLLKEDLKRIRYLPLSLIIVFLNVSVIVIGGVIGIIDRKFLFNKISEYEKGNTS